MPSSTSNSSRRISIAVVLGITLALLGIYDVLVARGVVPASEGLTQDQSNQIRSERYFQDSIPTPTLVMVGSSLTTNIRPEYVGPGVYNLGYGGGCACTGLDIIEHSRIQPKVVLVEVDYTLGLGVDHDMVDAITNPIISRIDAAAPILRMEYQPVSVVVNMLKKREQRKLGSVENRDKILSNFDQAIRRRMVKQVVDSKSTPMTEKTRTKLVTQCEALKPVIKKLTDRGIHVVLQMIPGEQQVAETVQSKQSTALILSEFPADQYEWLPAPPARDWATHDGIHLTKEDAGIYGKFVGQQLAKYLGTTSPASTTSVATR